MLDFRFLRQTSAGYSFKCQKLPVCNSRTLGVGLNKQGFGYSCVSFFYFFHCRLIPTFQLLMTLFVTVFLASKQPIMSLHTPQSFLLQSLERSAACRARDMGTMSPLRYVLLRDATLVRVQCDILYMKRRGYAYGYSVRSMLRKGHGFRMMGPSCIMFFSGLANPIKSFKNRCMMMVLHQIYEPWICFEQKARVAKI